MTNSIITNKDAIHIIRIFFSTLATILGLTTVVILGFHMDSNQFPGANKTNLNYITTYNASTCFSISYPGHSNFDCQPRGWVVMPHEKSNFEVDSALSGFGAATFVVFAISDVLFGVHTAMSLQRESELYRLNVVWTILSCLLFSCAVTAWQGMCDKINSGLTHSKCVTPYCQLTFGEFMTTYAVALMFSHIPHILMFFGVDGL
jgi:hypothetical protein